MAERWEFEVVNLRPDHDAGERRFRWHCRRSTHNVDQAELEGLLNRLGADGWSIASHDTDSRWGSNLILQRVLPSTEPEVAKATRQRDAGVPVAAPVPLIVSTPPVDLAPLLAELQALRAQLAQQPVPQVTVQSAPVHIAPSTVNFEPLAPQFREMLTVLRQIEAGQHPSLAPVVEPSRVTVSWWRAFIERLAPVRWTWSAGR